MDVIHKPEGKFAKFRQPVWAATILLVAATLIFWFFSSRSVSVPIQQLHIQQVQYGDLPLTINTYGKLVSKDTRFLSAMTSGTVEKIRLKPGAKVTADTVILELSNPQLHQQVESAELRVQQAESRFKKMQLELADTLLQHQSSIELLRAELESAQLTYDAEKKLEESGIVSKLQIQTSNIKVKQLLVRLDIAEKRLTHLADINETRLSVEKELVNLEKSQLKLHQEHLQSLTVKAGIDGVLQRLPAELGANVVVGEPLAIVGSVEQLEAELRVPQSQADDIQLGNQVVLNIANNSIIGHVSRIDPVVTDGYVTVEAQMDEGLPQSARPDINVQGVITAGEITDTLYIEAPVNVASHSKVNLFVLDPDNQSATSSPIQFGQVTGRYIQVISGLAENQKVVISDAEKWRSFEHINVTNSTEIRG